MSRVVEGLYGVVSVDERGVTHWELSDGRTGSDPQGQLHEDHPLMYVDELEVL